VKRSLATAGSPCTRATLAAADSAIARHAELSKKLAARFAASAWTRAPSRSPSAANASAAIGFSNALQLGQSP
jgi:hypothetical protein